MRHQLSWAEIVGSEAGGLGSSLASAVAEGFVTWPAELNFREDMSPAELNRP